MIIADTCPFCGAERPSWLGGTHYRYRRFDRDPSIQPLCIDRQTADQAWTAWRNSLRVMHGY